MVAIKLLILFVILTSLVCPEIVEAATKKQFRNIKRKKPMQNGKYKANSKQAPTVKSRERNGKMNLYNSHLWPPTTTYYRPATTSSLYQRSPSTASSSAMFYPVHWGNSYINPSSFMSSNSLRRTDDDYSSSSSPLSTALSSPIMPMSSSQIPTLYDMSAFTGNAGLMEQPLTSSNQNLWTPIGEPIAATPKPKLSPFNYFNFNDDGFFGGFLNQLMK